MATSPSPQRAATKLVTTLGEAGHSIRGVGVDICSVARIEAALAQRGPRLLQRLLRPEEAAEFHARYMRNPARGLRFLATRFAAKEALAKALGTGLRGAMQLQNASVVTDEAESTQGRPQWRLHDALAQQAEREKWQAHLSLSDEGDAVIAFVVVTAR